MFRLWFLDTNDNEYEHEVYINDPGGNFGVGYHSTSHIEGVWGTVKLYIATIYNKIPDINYILFLRKDELTYCLRDKSYIEKET